MKLKQALVYAVALIGISYIFDSVIQQVGRPSNLAYGLIWIMVSSPVFVHLVYRHRQRRLRNVTLTIMTAAILNLGVALAVTVALGGWGSLLGYVASYALPTLITMLPAWIGAALLGGVTWIAARRINKEDAS